MVAGRYTKINIFTALASAIDKKEEYTMQKDFKNQFYMDKIMQHIETFNGASRSEIEDLIFQYLPRDMAIEKKKSKV